MGCCWPNCDRFAWEKFGPLCLGHIDQVVKDYRAWVDGLPDRPVKKGPHLGSVYFVMSDGLCKIGWTRYIDDRMKAYPPSARVLAVMPGYRKDEGHLHKRFGHLLARGREWFRPDPSIDAYVAEVVAEHGEPTVRCGPTSEWRHGR